MPKETPELSVGDQIAVKHYAHSKMWRLYTIKRKTPTGRLVTDSLTFNPDLTIRGRRASWQPTRGTPATPELIAKVKHLELSGELSRLKFSNLTIEQLVAIKEIIDPGEAV